MIVTVKTRCNCHSFYAAVTSNDHGTNGHNSRSTVLVSVTQVNLPADWFPHLPQSTRWVYLIHEEVN